MSTGAGNRPPRAGRTDGPGVFVVGTVLTLLIGINAVSTDTLAPGVPALRDFFGTTTSAANLVFTVYVFAFGIMQLFYGPIADRLGRRPVLLGTMAVYAIATLLCSVAQTFELLLAARCLQGASAGAAPALARAVIRDLYGPERSRDVMSYVMSAFGFVAVAGPLIGGWLVAWYGWRTSFYFCAVYAVATIAAIYLFLKESRPADAPTDFASTFASYVRIAPSSAFLTYCVTNLFMYAGMYAWLAGSMLVLVDAYGYREDAAGAFFALSSAGFMLGAWSAGRLGIRVGTARLILSGSACAVMAAVVLVALAHAGIRSGAAVAVPAAVWMFGHGLHYPHSMAAAVAPFPQSAGAASSLIGFFQTSAGAGAAFLAGLTYDGTAVPLAVLLLSFSGMALLAYAPFFRRSP